MHSNLREFATPCRLNSPQGAVSVRIIAPEALDERLIDAWRRLGERALEPNAYLTPMFVLPALAHIASSATVSILLIEAAGGELIGIGLFNAKPLLPFLGLQSLVGFQSKHSYLSGLLVDRDHAACAVDAFFAFVSAPGTRCHGVRFNWLCTEHAVGALLLETARRHHVWWSESERMQRAALFPKNDEATAFVGRIPKSRVKDLRRCWRRLGETGVLDWRIHSGKNLSDEAIECFLALEHMGWKGEAGTSMRSKAANEQFFREMIKQFREADGVFFTELVLNERVIASTCNLISGNSAFAFKIGWDPGFARYSPGMLIELSLLEKVHEIFGHLDLIDSGSVEGSYLDTLWLDKRRLVSGVFATTKTGKLIFAVAAARRRLRRGATELQQAIDNAWQVLWSRIGMKPERGVP